MRRQLVPSIVVALVAAATASCKETVTEVIEVSTVQVTGASGPVLIGVETQLTARALDDRGNELSRRSVAWSSSNGNVASVDATGRVRGIGAGSATIAALIEGVSGTATVDVHFPAPTVTALNPTNVIVQSATFTLTVTGTNFAPASVVRWNGANRTTSFVNATTLTASIPASDLTAAAYASVTVVTPAPGGGTSSARQFAVRLNVTGPFIAAGTDHSCALSGFAAYCWGSNNVSQLGDGTSTDRLAATAVSGGISFLAISTTSSTNCGLDLIGLAYCWGGSGSIRGSGGAATGSTPNAVVDGKQYRAISVGASHACALDLSGTAWCWGSNFNGELGTGNTTSQSRPTAVSGGLTFIAISAGYFYSCGVSSSGAAYCWGENFAGQLGDGSTADRLVPAAVQTGVTFVGIAAGSASTCARTAAGTGYCWGSGFAGQLGQGSQGSSLTPVLSALPAAVTTLSSGAGHSCGLSAGTPICWGDNDYGQIGIGNTVDRSTPIGISGLPAVRDIAAGARHTCALTTNSEVYCWGSKGRGQLGDGTTAIRTAPVQVVSGATPFLQVQVGEEISCGLRTVGGRISCWGDGRNGQMGNGTTGDAVTPTDVSGATQYAALATGSIHSCGTVSGTRAAQCWGSGSFGQLGSGSSGQATTPVTVSGGQQYQQLATGALHTCGLNTAGQIFCWGYGNWGQLGNGGSTNSNVPVAVTAPAGVTFNSVTTGAYHTCATSTTGTLYCWGINSDQQLGDGTTTQKNTPLQVAGLTGIVEVSGGSYHTCARNAAGAVWCWGYNGNGELGTGTTSASIGTPTQVTGGLNFRSISAGRLVTCGVTTANLGYCWGYNFMGQLGTGSFNSTASPTAVSGGLSWSTIDTWSNHNCGMTTAGAAYCWGFMRVGELGIGQLGIETTPKRLQGGVFQVLSRRRMRM